MKRFYLVAVFSIFSISSVPEPLSANEMGFYKRYGFFSNRTDPSPESGDCSGYSLHLFRRGNDFIGAFEMHEGGCDFSGSPIYDVEYNPKTKEISFFSPVCCEAESGFKFEGRIGDGYIDSEISLVDKKSEEQFFKGKLKKREW